MAVKKAPVASFVDWLGWGEC